MTLSKLQNEVYQILIREAAMGKTPTEREMQKELGKKHQNSITQAIAALRTKGFIDNKVGAYLARNNRLLHATKADEIFAYLMAQPDKDTRAAIARYESEKF